MQLGLVGLFARSLAGRLGLSVARPPLTPLLTLLARHRRREWWRTQRRIADAMVKADPVDAQSSPSGIAVAKLHPPRRGRIFPDMFERPLLGPLMVANAAQLPLAVEADVEPARIGDRRGGLRRTGKRGGENCENIPEADHWTVEMAPSAPSRNSSRQIIWVDCRSGALISGLFSSALPPPAKSRRLQKRLSPLTMRASETRDDDRFKGPD